MESGETKSKLPKVEGNFFFRFDCSLVEELRRREARYWFTSLGLLSCYIICGLVIAALGASIQDIAKNVHRKSTDIAGVFVSRGLGSIFGSFVSAPVFSEFNAVKSLILTYVMTMVVLLWLPFISTLSFLHLAYFFIGTLTSIVSAGSILLLRKVHAENAGPWLGALGAALVSAGMIVPCVQLMFDSMFGQFCFYTGVVALGGWWLRMLPHLREDIYSVQKGGLLGKIMDFVVGNRYAPVNPQSLSPRRKVLCRESDADVLCESEVDDECHKPFFMTPVACSSMTSSSAFYTSARTELSELHSSQNSLYEMHSEHSKILGGKIYPSYNSLESRNCDEEIMSEEEESLIEAIVTTDPPHYWSDIMISLSILFIIGGSNAFSIYIETYVDDMGVVSSKLKAFVLMLFFGFGTFGNIIGIFIQMDIGDKSLATVTRSILLAGAAGTMLILYFPQSPSALWTGVAVYGFASAVTVGFCFNIANRLSFPSAKSTSIIMMGSSIGVSLIPYASSLLYKQYSSPLIIMYVGCLSMLIPIALLYIAPLCSYLKNIHKF